MTFEQTLSTLSYAPSSEQGDVYRWIYEGAGSAVIEAVAGSGKTTTLLGAMSFIYARQSSANVLFLAFNKHVADSLNAKLNALGLPPAAKTVHAFGLSLIKAKLGPKVKVENYKYKDIIKAWMQDNYTLFNDIEELAEISTLIDKICTFCRISLVKDGKDLKSVCEKFGLPYDDAILTGVAFAINAGIEMAKKQMIVDFADMLWLPFALDIKSPTYDYVLVDEAQDLNEAQIRIATEAGNGGRIISVGDRHQAIQLFAGARSDSIDTIKARTKAEAEFPLTTCYRCPEKIIKFAQTYVPSISPRIGAPQGDIVTIGSDKILDLVQVGDMILCRYTAPLVSLCLKLIAGKVKAMVRGKEIGTELVNMAKKVEKFGPYGNFMQNLEIFTNKSLGKLAKKRNAEQAIEALMDRRDSLEALYVASTDAQTFADFYAAIESIFSDATAPVVLSTIHRAKGLEASRVFIYGSSKLPATRARNSDEQNEQERNLHYVAITRVLGLSDTSQGVLFLVD